MSRYGMGVVDGKPSGDGDGGMGRGVGAFRVWEYPQYYVNIRSKIRYTKIVSDFQ